MNAQPILRPWIVAAALGIASCSMSADTKMAEQEVDAFHEKLNAGEFDAIYAAASDELKQVTKREEFVALLDAVHRKLGVTKSWSKRGWNVNYQTNGAFVTLDYSTLFDGGDASERFMYKLRDGKALLAGYHINSMALIVK